MFVFHTFHKEVLFPKEIGVIKSLMKPQFVVTYAIRETKNPALLDKWVTNTTFVTVLCPQRNCVSVGL